MEGNNNPPFSEGQKVVRIGKTIPGFLKRGNVYTVESCIQCLSCKSWKITIAELPFKPIGNGNPIRSCECGHVIKDSIIKYYSGNARLFAPIERKKTEISIDKEVLDSLPKITEERSDVKPQTVNN